MPPDEPRFTDQAQEMKEDRDWIVPRIGGIPSPDKPPVLFWSINLASLALPRVTEFTARIPSALASLLVLLLTIRLGRRLFGSEAIGLGGALVLLTGFEFFVRAQWVSCDMPLTAGVLAALTCFREALFEGGNSLLLGWLAAAVAVLTKGPVGLLWALLWVGCEAVSRRQWKPLFRLLYLPGIAVFIVFVGGWYVAFGASAGEGNVYNAIVTQNVSRYVSAWNSIGPWYFYFYQTPADLMPWSLFLPAVFVLVILELRRKGSESVSIAIRSSALFVTIAFAFFSGSSGKRGVYLLQILPIVALLIATAFLAAGRAGSPANRWRSFGLAGMCVLGVGLGLAAPLSGRSRALATLAGGLTGWEMAAFSLGGLALAAGALVALRLAHRNKPESALIAAAAGTAMLLVLYGTVGGLAANRAQNGRAFGRQIAKLVPPGDRIAIERGKFEEILFYSARKGRECETERQLVDALGSGHCKYAILKREAYAALHEHEPFRSMSLLLTLKLGGSTLQLLGPAGG